MQAARSNDNLDEADDDDEDYVPETGQDTDSGDDKPAAKRSRTSATPQPDNEDVAAQQRERDALWASFQSSVSTPAASNTPATKQKFVKIEKRYRFAGEDVIEVKEVPEDSDDAQAWPLWRDPDASNSVESAAISSTPPTGPATGTGSVSAVDPAPSSSTPAVAPKGGNKRPGPRKPKVSLSAVPTGSQKPKKLSTLDKSAMDWDAHVKSGQDAELKDTLEANRRGGGYLEKVEFMQRVEQRKEEAFEASKGTKRRR